MPVATPWTGWRLAGLLLAALLACAAQFALVRWLAAQPYVDAQWTAAADGGLELGASPLPALQAARGRTLIAAGVPRGAQTPVDARVLHRVPRWQTQDAARTDQRSQQAFLAHALALGGVQWHFEDAAPVTPGVARGVAHLGPLFWPLSGVAWALCLVALAVLMARPGTRALLFAVMAASQAGSLLILALSAAPGLPPAGPNAVDLPLRATLDLCTLAAAVSVFARHPVRLAWARGWIATAWGAPALLLALLLAGGLPQPWWWVQSACLALLSGAWVALGHAYRIEPNPYALVMRRLCALAIGVLCAGSGAVVLAQARPAWTHGVALGVSVAWTLLLASLLLLTPFLARSRQILRNAALLTGTSALLAALALLFMRTFAGDGLAAPDVAVAVAVAVFLALALHVALRRRLEPGTTTQAPLGSARAFDHIYRAAREAQANPSRYPMLLARLLGDLFEPVQTLRSEQVPAHARVLAGGSALQVPARVSQHAAAPDMALVLRFARRGQRLFSHEDARLADQVVEQLRRAVTFDRAVERGRVEERLRIAQDLHDDIGARLLTLMYQAPTPEMEDYLRHTLQDLKTLTRGLATPQQRLSHAAGEWKADLSQRLAAAQARLHWQLELEDDPHLTVVQWSALTRVLRELVTNALYHGRASQIDVAIGLRGSRLTLRVADDGCGRTPASWPRGLGLGGVRKRVKQLGGEVAWDENGARGIACTVVVEHFGACAPDETPG